MKFENIRQYKDIDPPGIAPDLEDNCHCPLILIKPDKIRCAVRGVGERRDVISDFNPETDILLTAWPGTWRTDVFQISFDDLLKQGLRKPPPTIEERAQTLKERRERIHYLLKNHCRPVEKEEYKRKIKEINKELKTLQ